MRLYSLRRLPTLTERRRANAAVLGERLADLPGLTVPTGTIDAGHVWHQYTVRIGPFLGGREAFAERLQRAGIGACVHYPIPLHRSPALATAVDLPHTDTAADQVPSLSVHPNLTAAQIEDVARAVTGLASSAGRAAA